ncbi:helix-turn-helix transcriptional regulator [Kibdelosporangium aridum]|uniref:helix-turn-helix transcriptional regulator n=1 Tax=Kibdelosporangium aridum TaxID=2030 RepID=UPI00052740DE|nr:transcriptional regulator [Kibdelosporangium aridum]
MSSPEIKAVAALDDDLRWRMYTFIRAERRPVTRDEAAASVGISRKLAAFHLDKLVDAGLLKAGYQAAGKVGRAPKVYEPTDVDIRVAIPQRQHDVLAEILLDAVVAKDVSDEAVKAAAQRGENLGTNERDKAKLGRLGAERALTVAEGVLTRYGFEPAREGPTCLRLRNCPFHPLAAKAPDLVCAINQAFLNGLLDGLEAPSVRAVLEPAPGECCVRLRGD